MNIDDIERAARTGNTLLPDDLTMPRQMLFLSLRALYQSFRAGTITKDHAHSEKLKILKVYGDAELLWKIYQETAQMRNRLSRYLTEIEKGGCDKCRLAVKIWDGRDKT
jgi:hypothetical protein